MSKVTLTHVTGTQNQTSLAATLNNNFDAIQTAIEKTLSRDGTSPNSFGSTLDMNSHRIVNLPNASSNTEPVTYSQFLEITQPVEVIPYGNSTPLTDSLLGSAGASSLLSRVDHSHPFSFDLLEINVLEYGAVGDGVTDDSGAIQDAVDYAMSIADGRYVVVYGTKNSYLFANPVVFSRASQTYNGAVDLRLPRVVPSNSWVDGVPLIVFSKNAYDCGVSSTILDCNFKSAGILTEGGTSGAYHTKVYDSTIRRYKGYGIQVGCFEYTTSSNTLSLWETVTGGTTGATARVVRIEGNNIYLADMVRNGTTMISGSETLIGGSGGSAVTTAFSGYSSSQSHIDYNKIHGLILGDSGFWVPSTTLYPGIWIASVDNKVFKNIVTRSEPSVKVDGWQNLFSMNHTFPVTTWADDHLTWRTNYEVWYAGNIFVNNYIDNGSIDFRRAAAAESLVIGNIFTKYSTLVSANTSAIRLFADSIGAGLNGTFKYTGNTFGGSGSSSFDSLISYVESGGNTFSVKLDTTKLGINSTLSGTTEVFAATNSTAKPIKVLSASTSSRMSFDNASRTVGTPADIGANGDNPAAWRDNVLTLENTSDSWDFKGNLLKNYLVDHVHNSNTSRTVGTSDTGSVLSANTSSAVTFTLSKSAVVGTRIGFTNRLSGTVTIGLESGAKINGGTTPKTGQRYMLCWATVVHNSDGSSAEWSLEGYYS